MLPKRLNSHMAYLNYVKASSFMCGLRNSLGWGNSWGWCNRFGDNCFDGNSLINYTGFTGSIMTNTTSYVNAAAGYGNGANAQQTQGAGGDDYTQMALQLGVLNSAVKASQSDFYKRYGVELNENTGSVLIKDDVKQLHQKEKERLENSKNEGADDNIKAYTDARNEYQKLSAAQNQYQIKMSAVKSDGAIAAGKVKLQGDHYEGVNVNGDENATAQNKAEADRLNREINEANRLLSAVSAKPDDIEAQVEAAKNKMKDTGNVLVTKASDDGQKMTAAQYTDEMESLNTWLKNLNPVSPTQNENTVDYDTDKATLNELIKKRNTYQGVVNNYDAVQKAESDVSKAEAYVKDAKKGHKKHKKHSFARWWYDITHKDSKDKKIIAAKGDLATSQDVLTQRQKELQMSIFGDLSVLPKGTYYNTD